MGGSTELVCRRSALLLPTFLCLPTCFLWWQPCRLRLSLAYDSSSWIRCWGLVDCESGGRQRVRMPQRVRYLFVCTNRRADDDAKGSCANKGSEAVRLALKEQLLARGLAKLEARACASSCLDQCSSGVCILVEPDHFFYGRVTLADVPEIVEGIASGQRVERLVLTSDDLAKG
jgi:(2Fe-2S) ferredoxin